MDGAMAAETGWGGAAQRMPVGVAGSIALHAALLLALFMLTPLRTFVVPDPPAISVDLIPFSVVEPEPAPEPEQAAPPELAAPPSDTPATETAPSQAPAPGVPSQDADGTFRAEDIPAGVYEITIRLNPPPGNDFNRTHDTIASGKTTFTVPEIPGGVSDEPLDIGVIPLKATKP